MKKDQKTDFLSTRVRYIPINDIRPNPQQPRRRFDSESLQELAASIAAYGILQPITVRQQGAVYELVAGERRWRAARIAGLRQVPCLLARVDEEDAALLALIENLQRRDLDYMEEAVAIARLLRRYGLSQQQAAQPAPAPAAQGWTCTCGQGGITGNFCPNCGSKKPEPKPAGDSWQCACGTTATGKFCPECGKPKPAAAADGWTCTCGAVNKGKFCAECGKPKPAGVPQYKCDKCGWEPADPQHPPKFCPECGDPFDDGDIV